MMHLPTPRPSMVLAAYAEPLVDGRRVIVFGDSSSGLAEHLLARGARLVHVYDPDAMRVAEAATRNSSRNVSYGPLAEGALAVRDGAFDVGLVENLAAVGDPASALRRLRRALGPRAAALVALPNPDVQVRLLPSGPTGPLDYYGLYDLVAAQFEHVRMLGQAPFVGYAVADFGAGGVPEPSLDSAFVPGGAEEPEWFMALASSISIQLDEFAVVQLPFRQALPASQTRELEAELGRVRAAELRARDRMASLEAEQTALIERSRAQGKSELDRAQIGELKQQLEQRDQWIQELETRLTIADARADEAQSELEEQRERSARSADPRPARVDAGSDPARRQVDSLRRELESLRRELDSVIVERDAGRGERDALVAERDGIRAELEARRRELLELRQMLADRDARIAALIQVDEEDAELQALESLLRERGARIRTLEAELREVERFGRQLVLELETAREEAPDAPAELRSKLDRLADENARREADLAAARWSVEELESRLLDSDGLIEHQRELERALQQALRRLQEQATVIAQLTGQTEVLS
jgi:flagellar biosynthesis chaperone FliJ